MAAIDSANLSPATEPRMKKGASGFTLIEVLVALAVLAIALSALIKGGSDNAANAAYLRDKTLAHWVAMNRVTELQLQPQWPATGKRHGTAEMGDREWRWDTEVKTTPDGDVRRLIVTVSELDSEGVLDEVVAFLAKPPPQAGPSP
jgi:general secretion pathway protein I